MVQTAAKLVLEPIFEAGFADSAYGYRPGRSAQEAVQKVHKLLWDGYTDVVDADLSKYFDTIPHHELMQCVARRVVDRHMLKLIKAWLKVPVHETNEKGNVAVSGGRKAKVGTPQGGVISPLLANIYFRRFLVAWERFGYGKKFQSRIVNYADDFVILTRRKAREALDAARGIIGKIGLTLNEEKTRTCTAGKDAFNFLGYTFEKLHSVAGKPYLGKRPSDKSVKKVREKIRELTASDQVSKEAETVVGAVNRVLRGYWNYYSLGTTGRLRWALDRYTRESVRDWTLRKHARPRKRAGNRKSGGAGLWTKVKAAERLLIDVYKIPKHPAERKPVACLVQ